MCGDLADRDDFEAPPRRPDLWPDRQAADDEPEDPQAPVRASDSSEDGDPDDVPA